MSSQAWRWKIDEAIERLRTRYEFIGRKTGAPFLALVYPPGLEAEVLKEWRTQLATMQPEFDLRPIDALSETQRVVGEIGAENIVASIADPMPGSDPAAELGDLWVAALADAVRKAFAQPGRGRPIVSLEKLAALFPAAGPRGVMQRLWDSAQSDLSGPVVVMVPGVVVESRTYRFVNERDEFMYRGDLL